METWSLSVSEVGGPRVNKLADHTHFCCTDRSGTNYSCWAQAGWHSAWSVHREHCHSLELSMEANSQRLPADPLDWSIREEGTATGSVGYSRNC